MHETEGYISLTEAAKLAPGRPSINCVWRWCRKGVIARSGERIRLQHVRIGGKLFTTAQWVGEFGQRLADADTAYFDLTNDAAPLPPRPRTRTEEHREEAIDRAERELEEAGA